MFGRVSRQIRRKLETFPESGMTYWIVTAQLRDGRRFSNVYVTATWKLGFADSCPFKAEEITDVEWEGTRGSRSSGVPVLEQSTSDR
jgi:hypothetical protein